METSSLSHVYTNSKTPLQTETELRALRSTLWVSLFLGQNLHLQGLQHRITELLRDVDRLLGDLDAA